MSTADVEHFLHNIPKEVRSVVRALRQTIRKTTSEVDETVLWGGLSYHHPSVGGRVKGAVCQINVSAGTAKLEFIHGIHLSDPHRLLKGGRVSKRYVLIPTVEDARSPAIAALIREASALRIEDTVQPQRGADGDPRCR